MRLELHKLCKIHDRKKQIYDLLDVSVVFPEGNSIAVLATEVRSSKALCRLLAGIEAPTRGNIIKEGLVSLPIGEDGYFHRDLSGEENIRFIAKIYGQDQNKLLDMVKDFAGVSSELKQKAHKYPATLKRKLTLSTSLLIEADYYLLHGLPKESPHPRFNKKVQNKLKRISRQASLIVATEDKQFIRRNTQAVLTINNEGRATLYENMVEGLASYDQLKKDNVTNAVE